MRQAFQPDGGKKEPDEPKYEFQKAGKQARKIEPDKETEEGKRNVPPGKASAAESKAAPAPGAKDDARAGPAYSPQGPPASIVPGLRVLPEEQYEEANWYDTLNLFGARAAFCLTFLAALYSWGTLIVAWSRGGGSLEAWSPRGRCVALAPSNPNLIRQLLQRVVHCGELFIYLGAYNPKPPLRQPYVEGDQLSFREVKKRVCTSLVELRANPLLFDTAWFGYACVVISNAEAAREAFPRLQAFLEAHRAKGRKAAATLNIIWDLSPPPSREVLAGWTALGAQANVRLIVGAAEPLPPEYAASFDELFTPVTLQPAAT